MPGPGESPDIGRLQQVKAVCERAYATTAVAVTTMVLANTVDREALVVHADDPLLKQAKRSVLSILPAPSLGDYGRTANVAAQITTTVISFESARSTSRPAGLIGTAAGAIVASDSADALADRSGWLTHAEKAQEDVGFSAIGVAWFTKFLLDRAGASKDKGRRWLAAAGAFAGTVALGLPLYEGSQGGKLDAVSHTAGLAVGLAAHKLGARRRACAQAATEISRV